MSTTGEATHGEDSTFGYETVSLLQARAYGIALGYAGGSFALALAAVVIGMSIGAQAR